MGYLLSKDRQDSPLCFKNQEKNNVMEKRISYEYNVYNLIIGIYEKYSTFTCCLGFQWILGGNGKEIFVH